MISCIIIEDQPPAQRILKKFIRDMGNLDLKETFSDALSALEYLKATSRDLIFLDIHLPKISGLDFLKILPYKPQIILTTAFSEYAIKGYELGIVDYLLKPFSFERFVKAVSKVGYSSGSSAYQHQLQTAQQEMEIQNGHFTFVKVGADYLKIASTDIRFIKGEGDYTRIITKDSRYLVSHSLKYWLGKLNKKWFCQIHKSYIVNINYIDRISGNRIYLDQDVLPIRRTFKESFFSNYLEDST